MLEEIVKRHFLDVLHLFLFLQLLSLAPDGTRRVLGIRYLERIAGVRDAPNPITSTGNDGVASLIFSPLSLNIALTLPE